MPWFGMDIGGTLSKLVFFEPNNIIVKNSNSQLLSDIVQYLTSNSVYGISGHRDAHLQVKLYLCISIKYIGYLSYNSFIHR